MKTAWKEEFVTLTFNNFWSKIGLITSKEHVRTFLNDERIRFIERVASFERQLYQIHVVTYEYNTSAAENTLQLKKGTIQGTHETVKNAT